MAKRLRAKVRKEGQRERQKDLFNGSIYMILMPCIVFRVPVTHDMLTAVLDPQASKTFFDVFTLAIMGLEILLFFVLPNGFKRYFFLVVFLFWRLSYNLGLGVLLKYQSEQRGLVNLAKKFKVFDAKKNPKVHAWLKHQFTRKMGKDYDFEVSPSDSLATPSIDVGLIGWVILPLIPFIDRSY